MDSALGHTSCTTIPTDSLAPSAVSCLDSLCRCCISFLLFAVATDTPAQSSSETGKMVPGPALSLCSAHEGKEFRYSATSPPLREETLQLMWSVCPVHQQVVLLRRLRTLWDATAALCGGSLLTR
ncbi:hypothetical protein NDU88_006261 [Pleurodeles waltl]|uniref:Uncharacterized protein n=1 Tax=Pleurodeles waltl TaxID=8319 RepID=A0AAV7WCY5_PLEWA|nr:hypothetical protein NDU88_006261 [Pleurodeles waltl]